MNQASFDTWTSLFLLAAFQGLFLSLILWKQKEEYHPGRKFLSVLVGLFSIMMMYYVAFWTGYNRYVFGFDGLFLILPFAFGPIFWVYFHKINGVRLPSNLKLHFIPLILHLSWVLSYRFSLFADLGRETIILTSNWIANLQALHVLIYALLMFSISIQENEENRLLKSFAKIAFLLFALAHASYYAMVFFDSYVLLFDYLISFSMALFIYGLAYTGLRFSNFQQKRNSEPLLTKASLSYYSAMLSDIMEKEQLYLDGDLNLDALSKKMGLSKHALSQLLNGYFKKNFSDYINSFRIKEAEKLLSSDEYQNLNVIEIAYRVGFNTKASFYNAFRKKNQVSPKEFRSLINSKSASLS
ncbi:helix-turn-helix transcriptional regulator [Hyphobacterium sp. CCMP332]|nr:helix-turn-helix transcriptional regulator [Hyphobacterium sp. CCMP332]